MRAIPSSKTAPTFSAGGRPGVCGLSARRLERGRGLLLLSRAAGCCITATPNATWISRAALWIRKPPATRRWARSGCRCRIGPCCRSCAATICWHSGIAGVHPVRLLLRDGRLLSVRRGAPHLPIHAGRHYGRRAVRPEPQPAVHSGHPHDRGDVLRLRWPRCSISRCDSARPRRGGRSIGAGVALCAGTLTRYDGWFLIPFVGLYFLWTARERRFAVAFVFCLLASLGPLFWLAHNWVLDRRSAGFLPRPVLGARHPGQRRLSRQGIIGRAAFQFYGFAAYFCAGPGLAVMGTLGVIAGAGEARLLAAAAASAAGSLLSFQHAFRGHPDFRSRCCTPALTTTCATDCRSCRCWRWRRRPSSRHFRGGCGARSRSRRSSWPRRPG